MDWDRRRNISFEGLALVLTIFVYPPALSIGGVGGGGGQGIPCTQLTSAQAGGANCKKWLNMLAAKTCDLQLALDRLVWL